MTEIRKSYLPPEPRIMEVNGREYRATIFSGNGKHYDALAADDPQMSKRMGTFLLSPICPIMDIVIEHKKNVAIYEQAVEIKFAMTQRMGELALA